MHMLYFYLCTIVKVSIKFQMMKKNVNQRKMDCEISYEFQFVRQNWITFKINLISLYENKITVIYKF